MNGRLASGIVFVALASTPSTPPPTVADIRGEHEFAVTVDSGRPAIRCVYVGDSENRPVEIACYAPQAEQPFQRIDISATETPFRDADYLTFPDMNLDRHADLRVLVAWGVTGNRSFEYYVWDPARRRFTLAPAFSVCKQPTDSKGCCTGRSVGGMAGNVFHESRYCMVRSRLVEVERVTQDWSPADRCFHKTTMTRVAGQLAVTATHVTCDPAWQ